MPWYSYFTSTKKNVVIPTDTNDWCVFENIPQPLPIISPVIEIPLKVDPKPHIPMIKSNSTNDIQKISSLKTSRLSQSIDPDLLAGKVSKSHFFHNIIRKITMKKIKTPPTNSLSLQVVPVQETFDEVKIDIPSDLPVTINPSPKRRASCGCLRFFSWLKKTLLCL